MVILHYSSAPSPGAPVRRARGAAPWRVTVLLAGVAAATLGWAPGAVTPLYAQSAEQSEAELEALRGRIAELQRDIDRRTRRRDRAAADLQAAEVEAARATTALAARRDELAAARRQADVLEGARQAALADATRARELLAEQLRLTYYTGSQARLRLLLNQERPSDLGRMLTYHDYLNRYRGERLAELAAALEEVTALTERARASRERLAALEARQAEEVAELQAARRSRAEAVSKLDAELDAAGGELARLEREEQELSELVARLRAELEGFGAAPETAFAELRGQLGWPVDAPVRHRFGERRGGDLRWNGLLLEADRGAPVRAVHHGRVVYADWLPGMGLLAVIDHGDGYMSLYGHHEDLRVAVGQWVDPGSVLGHVGDTGGRNRAGLYFEIRKDGRPVNPGPWLRGR